MEIWKTLRVFHIPTAPGGDYGQRSNEALH
jgi:hypothetical protein